MEGLAFCQNTIGHVPDFVRTLGNAGIVADDNDTISLFMCQSAQDFNHFIPIGLIQIAGGFIG